MAVNVASALPASSLLQCIAGLFLVSIYKHPSMVNRQHSYWISFSLIKCNPIQGAPRWFGMCSKCICVFRRNDSVCKLEPTRDKKTTANVLIFIIKLYRKLRLVRLIITVSLRPSLWDTFCRKRNTSFPAIENKTNTADLFLNLNNSWK